ncbi:MAG: DUF1592 domain-containing protein, partial [Pirellulales bacterium]
MSLCLRTPFLACVLVATLGGSIPVAAEVPPAVAFDRAKAAFVQAHCLKCHGDKAEEGIPRLDTIPYELATVEAAERWQRVLAVMNSGEMPPVDEPQPPATEKTEFLAALSATLVQARKALGDQGRVGLLRRLNRREYVNTIQDLLGVETEAEGLPDDNGAGAFDTVGSSLTMSSDQVERYLALGRKFVATAFADMRSAEHPPEKKLVHRETELEYHHTLSLAVRDNMRVLGKIRQWEVAGRKEDAVKQLGLPGAENAKGVDAQRLAITQGGHFLANCLALPRAVEGSYLVSCAYPGHFPFRSNEPIVIPPEAPAGDYVLRVRLGTSDDPRAEPRRFVELAYLEDGDRYKPRAIAVREVTNHFKSPAVIEFPVHLTPGSQRHFVIREKRFSSCDLQYFLFHRELNKGNGVGPLPTIWIDWVEWEGPTFDPAITDRRLRLLGSANPADDTAAARDVLTRFATQAFRGVEPTPAFIDRLLAVRQRKRPANGDFLDSLVEPMAIILASPGFLYLNEPLAPAATAETDRALSDLELASRLSYLLWAGPPDDQLLSAAAAGDLRKPVGLAAQVDRLVADPKSLRFAAGFAHQWLTLDRLDFFQFDWKNYPRFDQATQTASKQEIYETVHYLLRENVDARALLKSDFVVINDLMASYYGIDDGGRPVQGPHFRRVTLPADSPRGGLIATACILAMGSNGSSTSPVERGAWV